MANTKAAPNADLRIDSTLFENFLEKIILDIHKGQTTTDRGLLQ
jgi:hypothetical protein